MGWTFPYCTNTRAQLVEHLRRPERFGDRTELLAACTRGNHHWYLARNKDTGVVWIGLDLMQGGTRREPGWGYKDMDESMGPYASDCPLSYLDRATEPCNEHSRDWRDGVRKYHAQRKERPEPRAGLRVTYCGHTYELVRPAGPRRGWEVRNTSGTTYRMNARQLASAQPVA
jgi:hypothetical protein